MELSARKLPLSQLPPFLRFPKRAKQLSSRRTELLSVVPPCFANEVRLKRAVTGAGRTGLGHAGTRLHQALCEATFPGASGAVSQPMGRTL